MKLSSAFSKDLREKYKRRSARPRVGDSVRITRGEFKDIEGKVIKVMPAEGRLTVEGVTREKIKGGTSQIPLYASNVILTALVMDDKTRKNKLEAEA